MNNNADIDRRDNEGWTPLHVTASCGFISIAKYVNHDKIALYSIHSHAK